MPQTGARLDDLVRVETAVDTVRDQL